MSKGLKLFVVLWAVLAAFGIGSAVRELTDYDQAGVGMAFGIPAIVALFGMFWVVENWKDALTAAFTVTYIIFLSGIFAMFVFPQGKFELEGGAKVVFDNFTGLMMVIVSAYFGQEAVRAAAQAYSDGKVFGAQKPTAAEGASTTAMQVDTNARNRSNG